MDDVQPFQDYSITWLETALTGFNANVTMNWFLANPVYNCMHGLASETETEMYCERHDCDTRNSHSLNVVVPKL